MILMFSIVEYNTYMWTNMACACIVGGGYMTYMATGAYIVRRGIKNGKTPPDDWIRTGEPDKNGHTIGFIPILTDPSAKHILRALDYKTQEAVVLNQDMQTTRKMLFVELAGKTVEFIGPKVQGNPSNLSPYCWRNNHR